MQLPWPSDPAQPATTDETALAAARSIVDYLAEHPRATDSAEGIQRWWIAPQGGEVPLASVQRALDGLEREGRVVRLGTAALAPSYGRGPRFGAADGAAQ